MARAIMDWALSSVQIGGPQCTLYNVAVDPHESGSGGLTRVQIPRGILPELNGRVIPREKPRNPTPWEWIEVVAA